MGFFYSNECSFITVEWLLNRLLVIDNQVFNSVFNVLMLTGTLFNEQRALRSGDFGDKISIRLIGSKKFHWLTADNRK